MVLATTGRIQTPPLFYQLNCRRHFLPVSLISNMINNIQVETKSLKCRIKLIKYNFVTPALHANVSFQLLLYPRIWDRQIITPTPSQGIYK